MKKTLKGYFLGFLSAAVLVSGVTYAASTTKTIEALYNNIKIYVDGIKIDPKDAAGNAVEPFIYNGTTYLPVRAVGEAIGKTVSWDGETQSVYLGEKPGDTVYLLDVCPLYDSARCEEFTTENGKSFLLGGKSFTNGITLNNYSWVMSDAFFNLNAQYKTVSFDLGPANGSDMGITNDRNSKNNTMVKFYVDDKLVKEVLVTTGDLPMHIDLNVNYGMKLRITHDTRDGLIGLGNMTVR